MWSDVVRNDVLWQMPDEPVEALSREERVRLLLEVISAEVADVDHADDFETDLTVEYARRPDQIPGPELFLIEIKVRDSPRLHASPADRRCGLRLTERPPPRTPRGLVAHVPLGAVGWVFRRTVRNRRLPCFNT